MRTRLAIAALAVLTVATGFQTGRLYEHRGDPVDTAPACTEDEVREPHGNWAVCVHVEGDGWRVVQ